jgi:LPXTG-motif cell wall-anchored protein
MNKKTILIGLGVLAVAGIGYYMWKKKNETTSGASGQGDRQKPKTPVCAFPNGEKCTCGSPQCFQVGTI